jgi:hypothetical protein
MFHSAIPYTLPSQEAQCRDFLASVQSVRSKIPNKTCADAKVTNHQTHPSTISTPVGCKHGNTMIFLVVKATKDY